MTPSEKPLRPIGPTEPPPDPPAVPDDDDRDPESDEEPTHPHAPNRRRSLIPSPDLSVVVIKDRHVDGEFGTGGIHWRGQALVVW